MPPKCTASMPVRMLTLPHALHSMCSFASKRTRSPVVRMCLVDIPPANAVRTIREHGDYKMQGNRPIANVCFRPKADISNRSRSTCLPAQSLGVLSHFRLKIDKVRWEALKRETFVPAVRVARSPSRCGILADAQPAVTLLSQTCASLIVLSLGFGNPSALICVINSSLRAAS